MRRALLFTLLGVIAVIVATYLLLGMPRGRMVNVYNWEDYFGATTLSDFENETGIKVNLYTFEDEDFMVSDVRSNPGKYDVAVASNDVVVDMIEMRLLEEINLGNIPNFKFISEKFKNRDYDPKNEYSVPYLWGTTGIAFNKKYVSPEDAKSWAILWDERYAGRIGMLNNPDEVIGAALKCLGYSINSENESELEEARQLLLRQKELVRGYYDPITIEELLISEELWVAHCYSGSAMYAASENENISYVIPEEGAPIWVDNFIIPAGAPHKREAEELINFILRPDVNTEIVEYQFYPSANGEAMKLVSEEIRSLLYPPEDVLKRCEYFKELSEEAVRTRNKIWAELMQES
ncbi:MAG: Spermidine/putrescine-binding periplasmic protein [Candidatus Alkanophagales archaeon MCA70_species_2]|nr:Spermidine/putrescine-binding periplasmic protein [Candidatus Alkanophaga liquidiphilum]RLG38884.1 MAG: spermidine/putrescine ABC transporter substrate-binding protein [Candidatus Alkanophagales archaeon]